MRAMCSSITGGAGSAVVLAASLVLAGALSTGPLRAADAIQIETAARAMQPGEVVLFTITPPAAATRVSVHAFGRDIAAIRIDARTWRALVGIDLATGSGPADTTAVAETASGEVTKSYPITILPKRFPTRRLTVDPRLVEPPVSELPRIQRETARTNAIYASPAPLALWSGPFVRPVADPANSRFGSRSIFNGTRSSPHTGADFLSGAGTPIKAPNAGRVRLAENLYFSGNTVIVDHGLGLFSLFAHLSAFQVHEGDEVITGQVLGLVGATGRVTGPHLHWAMRATGARIDPLSLLAVLGR